MSQISFKVDCDRAEITLRANKIAIDVQNADCIYFSTDHIYALVEVMRDDIDARKLLDLLSLSEIRDYAESKD